MTGWEAVWALTPGPGDRSAGFRPRLAAAGGAAMVAVWRRTDDGTFWYRGPRSRA